ncbi:hypothetical protein FJT64_007138 [Amphibalanus amphitrite]|uniref:Uncharacterized protein n=1 Tax=Amphibalanus amphitrite TaxID=1232801 RepID=A0A6A4VFU1_AMPAM|nr:hypothetical protein FJT64_007138 [Amphibalanus amphitrite]
MKVSTIYKGHEGYATAYTEVRETEDECDQLKHMVQGRDFCVDLFASQVAIQDPATKRWSRHGVITDVGPHRRYYVRLPKGRVLTRNRRFLRQRYGHAAPDSPPPPRAAGSQGGEPPAAAA